MVTRVLSLLNLNNYKEMMYAMKIQEWSSTLIKHMYFSTVPYFQALLKWRIDKHFRFTQLFKIFRWAYRCNHYGTILL